MSDPKEKESTPSEVFVDVLAVEPKVADALVQAGYTDISSLKGIAVADLVQIDNVGDTTASKIVKKVSLLMAEVEKQVTELSYDAKKGRLSCFGKWSSSPASKHTKKCAYCPDHRECKVLSKKGNS